MAPSFDYAVSSLLCAEDNTSIFDEVDDNYGVVVEDDFEICNLHLGNHQNFNTNPNTTTTDNNTNNNSNNTSSIINQDQNFVNGEAYFSGFYVPSDECLASMFDKERQHFLGLDYFNRFITGDLDLLARNQAIDWIEKVQSHYNFGPLCAYLCVNYLDRFLSAYELPKNKTWMMQLLAVACLSLAAKVEETDVPLSLDLQVGETKFVFEAKTIQRMELLVLSTLKWRMQSVTPFSFIDYYLYKLSGDKMPPTSLIFQAIQLILCSIKGIDLMEFRPSEIAAAVAISVTQETQTGDFSDKEASSFLIDLVQKEGIKKCVEKMKEMRGNIGRRSNGIGGTNVPQSPIGVLDAACMSYKSDDTSTANTPSASCANSAHSSPAPAPVPVPTPTSPPSPKRRKLDRTLPST